MITPFTTEDLRAISYTIDKMTEDRNESGIEYGGYDGPQLTYKDHVIHLDWQTPEKADQDSGRYVLKMPEHTY